MDLGQTYMNVIVSDYVCVYMCTHLYKSAVYWKINEMEEMVYQFIFMTYIDF